jgi:hypothetical protein
VDRCATCTPDYEGQHLSLRTDAPQSTKLAPEVTNGASVLTNIASQNTNIASLSTNGGCIRKYECCTPLYEWNGYPFIYSVKAVCSPHVLWEFVDKVLICKLLVRSVRCRQWCLLGGCALA